MATLDNSRRGFRSLRCAMLWAVACLCLTSTGCLQRRITIRSNPPGALVTIGNEEIGLTPVSTDYVYYGAREIRLQKDGYETLTVLQEIPSPWYDCFPLDFVTENLVPGEIRDERTFTYNLVPMVIVPDGQLLERAEGLRRGGVNEGYVPSAVPGPYVPPALRPAPPPTGSLQRAL